MKTKTQKKNWRE